MGSLFTRATETKKAHTGHIVGIDTFGRKVNPVSGYKKDKYVGLFYHTWHGYTGTNRIFDVTKIMREHPEELWKKDSTIAPINQNYYFNEPLYGYYNSADPWVIRKHLELFMAADIDFLALDFTNAIVYDRVMPTMLDIYMEYLEQGYKVPQLVYFTNTESGKVVQGVYDIMYKDEKYKDLWFYGPYDKPLIIAWEDDMPEELRDFFHIRPPQWPDEEFMPNGFPYVDKVRPQRTYTDLVVVSVTQHTGGAFSWSFNGPHGKTRESWGRGYTTDNPTNWDPERIQRGANFQEQWDYAISVDPQIIFVTGWNEWVACKFVSDDFKNYGDVPYWVDTFNTEFSRDIEMTRSRGYVVGEDGKFLEEGYGDNFYLQFVENVRRFKGIKGDTKINAKHKTVDITNPNWDADVGILYENLATKKVARDFIGHSDRIKYRQAAPDNFIKNIRVTHDNDYIYFRVETDGDITPWESGKTNWMNLFIGIEGSKKPAFENYQFVVNRNPAGNNKTSLEASKGGYDFEKVQDIDYLVSVNVIQFAVPRAALGIGNDAVLYFKAADSIEHQDDIMDYYVSGCSVPMGRLSYLYEIGKAKWFDNGEGGTKDKFELFGLSLMETLILGISIVALVACGLVITIITRKKKG